MQNFAALAQTRGLIRIGTRVPVPESGTKTKVKETGAGLESGRGSYNNMTGSNFEMGWGWNVGVDKTGNAIEGRA